MFGGCVTFKIYNGAPSVAIKRILLFYFIISKINVIKPLEGASFFYLKKQRTREKKSELGIFTFSSRQHHIGRTMRRRSFVLSSLRSFSSSRWYLNLIWSVESQI